MLLLNDAPLPKNVSQVPRVTVSACVASQRGEDGEFIEQDPLDVYGAMSPTDSMREQVLGEMTPIQDCRVYLDATATETFGTVLGGNMTNKRIVRCRLTDHWLLINSKIERIKEKDAKIFRVGDEESDWIGDPKDDDEKVDHAEEAASAAAAAAAVVADQEQEHAENFGESTFQLSSLRVFSIGFSVRYVSTDSFFTYELYELDSIQSEGVSFARKGLSG